MKPKQNQPTKTPPATKTSFPEGLKKISDARLEKLQAEKKQKYAHQEEEMMLMMYGPQWRTKAPGLSEPKGVEEKEVDDEDDCEYDDDEDVGRYIKLKKAS